MTVAFYDALDDDAEALTALHAAAAANLTARFGQGPWSHALTVRRVETVPGRTCVRVGRYRDRIVAAFRLQTKKPWAIDVAYFTPVRCALYLTGMVVAVAEQRRGVGRAALEDALALARAWPADAIRLDAYDAEAGAGPFYARCNFTEQGRATYRKVPLVYYERLIR